MYRGGGVLRISFEDGGNGILVMEEEIVVRIELRFVEYCGNRKKERR